MEISKTAVFSNYLGIKRKLEEIPYGFNVVIDLENTKLIDHSVMENLHLFQLDYENNGGIVKFIGIDSHRQFSKHQFAGRKKVK